MPNKEKTEDTIDHLMIHIAQSKDDGRIRTVT